MQTRSSLSGNLALLLTSAGIAYLIIEILVFRAALPLMPLKFHGYLGDLYTLAQSSKAQLKPKNYIALVGDSYAQGKGDWLLSADHRRNSPFHSAHVINKKTGQDVVTFGKSGAGSIDGIMINPIRNFRRINSSLLYDLEDPKTIVVYFYEGNDLNNNLRTIKKYITTKTAERDIDRRLEAFVEDFFNKSATSCSGIFGSASCTGILGNAFAMRFMSNLAPDVIEDWMKFSRAEANPRQKIHRHRKKTAHINKARVAGAVLNIPDTLQAPAIELNDNEHRVTVKAFEIALSRLRRFFPDTRIIVTVVPAPLTVYELASNQVSIQTYENRAAVNAAEEVEKTSNDICELVESASSRVGADFIDVRDEIREVALNKVIHGPQDWKHFNKEGYEALGNALAAILKNPLGPSAGCSPL